LQRSVRWLVGEFSVRIRGELGEQQLQGILSGTLDSGAHLAVVRCEPAGGEAANRWYTLAARGASGKDVRQLFERQGRSSAACCAPSSDQSRWSALSGAASFASSTPRSFAPCFPRKLRLLPRDKRVNTGSRTTHPSRRGWPDPTARRTDR